jgi:hypothetical protein
MLSKKYTYVRESGANTAGPDFRFYDNRGKYLMFVNTCSEKWVVADRVARELDKLNPIPSAWCFFDAGMSDGTVLARVTPRAKCCASMSSSGTTMKCT